MCVATKAAGLAGRWAGRGSRLGRARGVQRAGSRRWGAWGAWTGAGSADGHAGRAAGEHAGRLAHVRAG